MFITFEGIDGSGKSTIMAQIQKLIMMHYPHLNVVYTREPGGANVKEAEAVRSIILDPQNTISAMSEAILFAASRRLHLEQIIWPSLKEGKIVVCDRYIDSSLAYQGGAGHLGVDKIRTLNELITDKTYPDLTFLFVLTPEQSRARLYSLGQGNDRIENKPDQFFEDVYQTYQQLAQEYASRYVVIDAAAPMEKVLAQVWEIFQKRVLNG